MKRGIGLLSLFLILGILFISIIVSGQETRVESSLIKESQKNGSVSVIVFLKSSENITEFNIFGRKIYSAEKNGSEIRDEVIDKIGSDKVQNKYSSFNGFAAEVSEEELQQLINDERVLKIERVGVKKLFLQESAPLINATKTWPVKISGVNLTGKDETVCVIDTGVNSSHPDLSGKVIAEYCYCSAQGARIANCCPNGLAEDDNATDSEGHGTHVSGIIAASGGITGIAPESKLAVVKIFGDDDNAYDNDLISAIEWCINNATKYNISVISMSLGGGAYSGYCDNEAGQTALRDVINNAVGKNISVIVASGNDASTTQISSPACIQNATSVGDVYDKNIGGITWGTTCTDSPTAADQIVCHANRNSLLDLVAPGALINSTWLRGYKEEGGTSMATPMVAASFAILREFYRLQTGRILTPMQIQNALNVTGKRIPDTATGLNFSRVNIYSAVLYLDDVSPNVTLKSPENGIKTVSQNLSFSCNTTDLQLKNVTLRIWNSSGVYNESNKSVYGGINESNWNITSISFGNYLWNCYSCDLNNNCGYSISNFSFSISSLVSRTISPINGTSTNQAEQNFTCNASSNYLLTNVSFNLWNSTDLIYNSTKNLTGLNNETRFNFTFSVNGNYSWNCKVYNNQSISSFSESNSSLIYDTLSPNMNILSPLNNSWQNAARFNVTLDEIGACKFSLDGQNNVSMGGNQNFSYVNSSIDEVNHNVSFYCNDSAGNNNYSSILFFRVDKSSPNISLIEPLEGYSETSGSTSLNFKFNISDNLNISSCKLIIGGNIQLNQSEVNNSTNTISYTLTPGGYSWQINCTDEAGNEGNSSARGLTINSPTVTTSGSSGGGGGGGGGGGSSGNKTYTFTEEQTKTGITKDIGGNEAIKFVVLGKEHLLIINKIENQRVNVTLHGSTVIFILNLSEEKKFELNQDNFYDLNIKLNDIKNNKANFTIKEIHEAMVIYHPINETKNETSEETKETNEVKENKSYITVIVVCVTAALIALIIFAILHFKHFKKSLKTEEKVDWKRK